MRMSIKLMATFCLLANSLSVHAEDVVLYAAASLSNVLDELTATSKNPMLPHRYWLNRLKMAHLQRYFSPPTSIGQTI